MTMVNIQPMPHAYRHLQRFLPLPPPIFTDGDPTAADRELALTLWRELDTHSRLWYTYGGTVQTFAGLPLTAADIDGMRDEHEP